MTGVVLDYALPTPPSSAWAMCYGQALVAGVPETAALRKKLIDAGFPHGKNGNNDPLVPDGRGRVFAGWDSMGGTAAGRLTTAGGGVNGAALGAVGGAQAHTLTAAQMPQHNHAVTDPGHSHSVYDPTHTHSVYDPGHTHSITTTDTADTTTGSPGNAQGTANRIFNANVTASATGVSIYGAATGVSIYASGTGISTQNNGSGAAHPITQPTGVMNKIIKL
nr:tail fiber protein [Microvirga lupini]